MKNQPRMRFFKPVTAALVLASLSCGIGDSISTFQQPEDVRLQDSRVYTPAAETSFSALAISTVDTDRWTGVLKGAAYRI